MAAYSAAGIQFISTKTVTHCVVKDGRVIMARCGSLELAERAKAKDERLYPSLRGRLQVVAAETI